ncbi:MAG: glycosyltransferase family 2 protein [SAR324 cluster bacterium]
MPSIAFTLIGHNEASHLPRTLESVRWADQIVFVDCESTDGSMDIARRYTSHVLSRPNIANLNINKNAAIDRATTDWVFLLDADEVIPAALADEIRRVLGASPRENAFRLARRNHFFGRWVRHGGQYPDYQTRLFRRGKARFPCRHVHERLEVQGAVGTLREPFDHYTVDTPLTAIRKMNFNSSFNAAELARSGRKPGVGIALRYLLTKPASRFIRRYIFKGGFLDGWPGLVVAAVDAIDFPFRLFKFWYWAEHPEESPDTRSASGTLPEGYG